MIVENHLPRTVISILADGDFLRIETVALQEGEIPQGEEIAGVAHVVGLLLGAHNLGHMVELLPEEFVEALRIAGAVAVEESVFHLGARVFHQDVILAGEGVQVVVSEVGDDGFHVQNDLIMRI